MKKVVVLLAVLGLLALAWAALHDIAQGNEPSYAAEYTVLVATLTIFAALLWRSLRNFRGHQDTGASR